MGLDIYHMHQDENENGPAPAALPSRRWQWAVWLYEHFIFIGESDEIDLVYLHQKFTEARRLGAVAILDIEKRATDEKLAALVRVIRAYQRQFFPDVQLGLYPLAYWHDPNCHTLMTEYPTMFEDWVKARKWIGRTFDGLFDILVPHMYQEQDHDHVRLLAQGRPYLDTLVRTCPWARVRPAYWHWTNYPRMRPTTAAEARAGLYIALHYAHGYVWWNYDGRDWATLSRLPAVQVYAQVADTQAADPVPELADAPPPTLAGPKGALALPPMDEDAWAERIKSVSAD